MTQRIRIALVGLSSTAKTSWAADGHLPYLLSARGQTHYDIAALLNSSVESAEAAKREFNLPAHVKAYGDPASVAADPDIDLVVCNTRVDVHYSTVEPSVAAGKAVFVEWPLTESLETSLKLLKRSSQTWSIVGLQARVSPVILKLKEVLREGTIGKVLSSNINAFGVLSKRDGFPERITYFAQREVGGNPITIHVGHMLDYVLYLLGDFSTFDTKMQIQRPFLKLRDRQGLDNGSVTSDVPDLLNIHGSLSGDREYTERGAVLSIYFRNGPPFKGTPAFVWTINGEKGELRVTAAAGPFLQTDSYWQPVSIELHNFESEKVENIPWDWKEWQKELSDRGRNTAEVYERYAQWYKSGTKEITEDQAWPTMEDALQRMRTFDTMFHQYDADTQRKS